MYFNYLFIAQYKGDGLPVTGHVIVGIANCVAASSSITCPVLPTHNNWGRLNKERDRSQRAIMDLQANTYGGEHHNQCFVKF